MLSCLCPAQGRALPVGEVCCQAGALAGSPARLGGAGHAPLSSSSCFKAQWGCRATQAMLLRTPSRGATPFSRHVSAPRRLAGEWCHRAQRLVGKEPTQRTEASLHGPCFPHQWEGTILFSEKRKQTLRDYFQHRGQFPQVSLIHALKSLWTLRQTLRWEEPETPGTGAGLKGTEVFSKEPFVLRKPDSKGGPALGSHPPGDPELCEESVRCSPHMHQCGPAWEPHRGVRHIPFRGIPRPAGQGFQAGGAGRATT